MSNDWRDQIVGARMQVDQQFQDRLEASEFTRQEWGLIMTAIEFRVERPDSPEGAELVADTSKLDQIMPELERVKKEMGGAMGPGGQGGGSSTGGILGRFRQYLGGLSTNSSGGSDEEREAAATVLVQEYATSLQAYLEDRGRWEDVREAAADQQ